MWHASKQLAFLSVFVPSLAFAADQEPAAKPSAEQIQAWRAEGPAAVDRLMVEREKLIAEAEKIPGKKLYSAAEENVIVQNEAEHSAWKRVQAINDTIDAVAAAKYSHESGLYWYTDEAEAQRVAKEQGKPVLALRLLGNLDEELSCANSRYFRILLYPDEAVRKLLHDKFVLTWRSVRPVPKITVDFGDGRKVERTITGNSVHYVLLPSGQVVDVFPGLYGPKPFCERLEKAAEVAKTAMAGNVPGSFLTLYRKGQLAVLKRAWEMDCKKFEELQKQPPKPENWDDVGHGLTPPREFWTTLAEFHPEYFELSKASEELVKHEVMAAYYARMYAPEHRIATKYGDRIFPVLSFNKGGDEGVFNRLLSCVKPALAADTLHNDYRGRYTALNYLEDSPDGSVESLNRWVYHFIFGYNPDDPWAGLANLDSLTALPKDRGLTQAPKRPDPVER